MRRNPALQTIVANLKKGDVKIKKGGQEHKVLTEIAEEYSPYPPLISDASLDLRHEKKEIIGKIEAETGKKLSPELEREIHNVMRRMLVQGFSSAASIITNGVKELSHGLIDKQFYTEEEK